MTLEMWEERYNKANDENDISLQQMKDRYSQYMGSHEVVLADGSRGDDVTLVRNFTFELIESQIDSSIPMPKVTPMNPNPKYQENARTIEAMIKNELDRLKMEYLNDEDERVTYVHGGDYYHIEWDNSKRTHNTVGEISIKLMHPMQVIPQGGISELEHMDYIFAVYRDTKDRVNRRYGVDLDEYAITNINSSNDVDEGQENNQETIDIITAYYINETGGIGVFTWAGDKVLEDIEDYQARRGDICTKCGRSKTEADDECVCGNKDFEERPQDFEELVSDILCSDGSVIPSLSPAFDDDGNPIYSKMTGIDGQPVQMMAPTKIPYYTPNKYPIVVRKNVSVFGQLLGDSDCDKIKDLQQVYNMLATKVVERLLKGGSVMYLPEELDIETSDREMKVVRVSTPEQVHMMGVLSLEASISQDLAYMEQLYQHAKSTLGITDSFQGKPDTTAMSGVAKQAQIQQAAGRIESKRKIKEAAYAELFEMFFKYMLAYADEPRKYVIKDGVSGQEVERTFSKYDFLERDETGKYYYNDQYLFSVDRAGTLGKDRQLMWQETRLNFQSGAFGNPQMMETLIIFWREMESNSYPNASSVIRQLEQIQQQQQEQAMMQMQQQAMISQAMAGQQRLIKQAEGGI